MSELSGLPYGTPMKVRDGTYEQDARTQLTNDTKTRKSPLVPDAPTPVDNPDSIDLKTTRRILAEVAVMHEARGRALDASGLSSWSSRCRWLLDHPITEWFPADHLQVLERELSALRADGRRMAFGSRSVPKPRRKHRAIEFTATQLEIASRALEARTNERQSA